MTTLREAFEKQAESCADLGSAFTAGLLRLVGARLKDNHPVGAALFRWPFGTFRPVPSPFGWRAPCIR